MNLNTFFILIIKWLPKTCFSQLINIFMQQPKFKTTYLFPSAPKTVRGELSSIDTNQHYVAFFNGPTVFFNAYHKQAQNQVFTHLSDVSAIKFSRDGKRLASIDQKGTLVINEVLPNKLIESKVFNNFYVGAKAISWSSDRSKISVVGSGKNRYGRVAAVDIGTDVGEIGAVTANLNAVSYHPVKKNRIIAGGDQFVVKVFEGPPFKFVKSLSTHTGYINCIEYSPKGQHFVSGGADRKIVIYSNDSVEMISQRPDAHAGSITGLDWLDDQHFVTTSTDRFIKVWNIKLQQIMCIPTGTGQQMENKKILKRFQTALKVNHYDNNSIYTVSLNGDILKFKNPLQNKQQNIPQIIVGARNKIISLENIGGNKVIGFDSYGRILVIDLNTNQVKSIEGNRENKLILDGTSDKSTIYALLGDHTVLAYKKDGLQFIGEQKTQNIKAIVSNSSLNGFFAASDNRICHYSSIQGKPQNINEVKNDITTLYCNNKFVIYGGFKGEIGIFSVDKLQPLRTFENCHTKVTCIAVNENHIFVGDSMSNIKVWLFDGKQIKNVSQSLGNHSSIITNIIFKGNEIFTFGMDNRINIWKIDSLKRLDHISEMHKLGIISAVQISGKLITSGGDLVLKIWE